MLIVFKKCNRNRGNVAVVVRTTIGSKFPSTNCFRYSFSFGKTCKMVKSKKLIHTSDNRSSGKTSVKEMTAAILQHLVQDKDEVLFTKGNFNNDVRCKY